MAVSATRFSLKGTCAGDRFATAVKHAEVASMRVGSLKLIRVVLMLLMAASCASAALAQTFTTYAGEASALSGTVAGIPVNLAGTGTIDPSGGARDNSLVCYPGGLLCYAGVPDATSGLLSAEALSATTVGRGDTTYAHSSLGKLSVLVSGLLIKADYVEAEVKSICKDNGHGGKHSESKGRSEFSQLMIGGTPITVTGLPNQLVNVPSPLGGIVSVIINEQTVSNGYLIVRALHIKAPSILGVIGGSDLSVAMGKTKIDCGDIEECFAEKVTGGGFVIRNGAKITFAVAGRNGDTWGHLVAINHKTGDKFQATTQTTVFLPDGSAEITGFGEINGQGNHAFVARVRDGGEPGKGKDEFSLTVPERLQSFNIPIGTKIDCGNIQFHKPKGDCDPEPPEPPVFCDPVGIPTPGCVPPPTCDLTGPNPIDGCIPVCGILGAEEPDCIPICDPESPADPCVVFCDEEDPQPPCVLLPVQPERAPMAVSVDPRGHPRPPAEPRSIRVLFYPNAPPRGPRHV
jgi:hypothetical protein